MDQEIRLSENFLSDSWLEDFRRAFRRVDEIRKYFGCDFSDTDYRLFLPQSLAARIKKIGVDSPLGKQFLPHEREQDIGGFPDPIGDQINSPVSGLVHRYENRMLFFPTSLCPVNCRYCFRKNELVSLKELPFVRPTHIQTALDYLQAHPEISEVILSGGDPLMIRNSDLESILRALSAQKQLKFLRIHSRVPVSFPERIDDNLIEILSRYQAQGKVQILLALHLNHADELQDDQVLAAISKLKSTGLRLLTQTVLLRGVNDNLDALVELFEKIAQLNLQAYYLHHPDQVRGGMHFYLSLDEGRKLVASLRNKLPGWAIPQYIYDIPGGFGKTSAFSTKMMDKDGIERLVIEPSTNLH